MLKKKGLVNRLVWGQHLPIFSPVGTSLEPVRHLPRVAHSTYLSSYGILSFMRATCATPQHLYSISHPPFSTGDDEACAVYHPAMICTGLTMDYPFSASTASSHFIHLISPPRNVTSEGRTIGLQISRARSKASPLCHSTAITDNFSLLNVKCP